MITKQVAQAQVKEFRSLYNKEGQPALKKHYQRQLVKATNVLNNLLKYDSGFKVLRTPFKSAQIKPWEAV